VQASLYFCRYVARTDLPGGFIGIAADLLNRYNYEEVHEDFSPVLTGVLLAACGNKQTETPVGKRKQYDKQREEMKWGQMEQQTSKTGL